METKVARLLSNIFRNFKTVTGISVIGIPPSLSGWSSQEIASSKFVNALMGSQYMKLRHQYLVIRQHQIQSGTIVVSAILGALFHIEWNFTVCKGVDMPPGKIKSFLWSNYKPGCSPAGVATYEYSFANWMTYMALIVSVNGINSQFLKICNRRWIDSLNNAHGNEMFK